MAHGKSPRHARRPKKASAKRPARKSAARKAVDDAEEVPDAPPKRARGGAKSPAIASGGGPVRLQKLLAAAGFGSRRDVEQFLLEERVTVNGQVAGLGDKADPLADQIRVDGERLARERPAYWIVNKPRGVITTVRDNEGRRTVMDLMPRSVGRVFPVGRLDLDTTGLLLMTNDGDTAHVLLHPSLGNEREYRVNVKGSLDRKAIGRLEKGVSLEEGRTAGARVSEVRYDPESATTSLTLTLVEGKKRQIRRSLLLLGFPVRRLARVRMGPLRIGRLAVGEARPLRSEERRALLEHVRKLRSGEQIPRSPSPPVGPTPGRRSAAAPKGPAAATPRKSTARSAPKSPARRRSEPPAVPARPAARPSRGDEGPAQRPARGDSGSARGASGATRGSSARPPAGPARASGSGRSPARKAGARKGAARKTGARKGASRKKSAAKGRAGPRKAAKKASTRKPKASTRPGAKRGGTGRPVRKGGAKRSPTGPRRRG